MTMSLLYATTASIALWFSMYGLTAWYVRLIVLNKTSCIPDAIRKIFFAPISLRPSMLSQYVESCYGLTTAAIGVIYLLCGIDLDTWYALQGLPIGYCIYHLVMSFGKYDLYLNNTEMISLYHVFFILFSVFASYQHPNEVAIVHLAELSAPFIHTSYAMIKTQTARVYPRLFQLSMYGSLVIFAIFRILSLGLIWVLAAYNHEITLSFITMILWCINYGWFVDLLDRSRVLLR